MGWNTSALFVKDFAIDDVIHVLPDVFEYTPTGRIVDGEHAMSGASQQTLFFAVRRGWCEVWDPDQRFAPRIERLVADAGKKLAHTTVLSVLFASVTSTYGFSLYEGGKLVRHAMFESGETKASSGAPLPAEVAAKVPTWGHDESFLWTVIRGVTGVDSAEVDDEIFAEFKVSP